MKHIKLLILFAMLTLANAISHAALSYTTTWVGNTFGDNARHVGNCARAIWVAPEGVVYTASLWDENAGGIGIYQNGQNLGSIGAHGEIQGCSITGNSTWIFAEEQGVNGGKVGRYNRATKVREIMFVVSITNKDSVCGLAISPANGLLYASDTSGNRIRVFDTNGVWQQDWTITNPGALAVDSAGNVWVAQKSAGTIQEFNATGGALRTITMASASRPSALYVDTPNAQLMVGDQGPDQNIKIYGNLGSTPTLVGTFGVTGGYLSTAGGAIKGTVGDKRFTRVMGIGKDSAGNLYVSHSCWGGTWDLGRDGGTDLHCYNSASTLLWTVQAQNFEGNGAVDTASDGTTFYTGKVILTGSGGAGYVANTVDPFTYPADMRIITTNASRGWDFGMLATVGSNRILIACGQNSDIFFSYHFNAANGYIGIPDYTWGTGHERNGFCLDSAGNVWEGRDKTFAIWFNQLLSFDANGTPIYAAATSTPTPASISPLGRIVYLPASDTMILAQQLVGVTTDWTALGTRVEVYRGWRAGNTNTPNTVITLSTNLNPKAMAAAGNYLFVGYVHTIPNIDAYNLTTGAKDLTMTNNPSTVYVGNDVDSMYGICAYQKVNGDYVITKDNYNGNSVIIHTMTTGTPPPPPPPAPTGLSATAASSSQINLSWTASSGATSYNVKRATVSGGPYTTVATGVTATSYSNTGLAASTTYYYVVSAVNAGGESANSAQASATTLAGGSVPPAPTGVTATAGNTQVSLSWTASSGATSYNIKRATVNGGPYTTVATGVTSTSYVNTGLVNGTTYYYVVSAVNSVGESPNSAQVSATPTAGGGIPPAPTGLTATDPGNNDDVLLSWSASTGATSYNVKRSNTSGGPYTTLASPTSTSYTATTGVPGTTYYYVVSAVNVSGESPNSAQISHVTP
jgi:fibronectin type 3 domain-containing protein